MTVPNPQRRTLVRRAVAAGLVGLLALSGCKSRDGNGGSVGSGGTPKRWSAARSLLMVDWPLAKA